MRKILSAVLTVVIHESLIRLLFLYRIKI